MAYGKKLKWFQDLEDAGNEIEPLQNKPEVFDDLIAYFHAWNELSTSRQSTMGIGYIDHITVTDYLNEERIWALYERREYRHWITKIDRIYVELAAEKEKNKPKTSSKPPKGRR